ncbi:hypothetical protein IK146_02185 [Candidatus Saccharibacteria bacterium]|nr:hypothetical protein [Candidatus Saccharibacteria bacterium]
MESLKYYPGEDGAVDALERKDVRRVWRGPEVHGDPFAVKPGERFVDLGGKEGEIRPENIRDYGEDRIEENVEMLEEIGSTQLVDLYKKVVEDNPQLCVVKLVDEGAERKASFDQAMKDTTTGQIIPVVRFNFSNPDAYSLSLVDTMSPEKDDSDARTSIEYEMKMLAVRTGADWQKCARSKKLAAGMAFLREMGRAEEFIDDFLVPEYTAREGISSRERMADSVAVASSKLETAKSDEAKESARLQEPMNPEYRVRHDLPHEKHADEFALNFMTEHYDDFFIVDKQPADTKEAVGMKVKGSLEKYAYGEDRIHVQFGSEVPIDEDLAHILGVSRGNKIRVEPVLVKEKESSEYDMKEGDYGIYGYEASKRFDEDGNYVAPKHARGPVGDHERIAGEGVASTTLREGAPLYIRKDPNEEAKMVCDKTVGVRYIPSRDAESGEITTEILYNNTSGLTFSVESLSD